jgi:hypothetical protein
VDEEADYALPFWAGVIPLRVSPKPPQDDGLLLPEVDVPASVEAFMRRRG